MSTLQETHALLLRALREAIDLVNVADLDGFEDEVAEFRATLAEIGEPGLALAEDEPKPPEKPYDGPYKADPRLNAFVTRLGR